MNFNNLCITDNPGTSLSGHHRVFKRCGSVKRAGHVTGDARVRYRHDHGRVVSHVGETSDVPGGTRHHVVGGHGLHVLDRREGSHRGRVKGGHGDYQVVMGRGGSLRDGGFAVMVSRVFRSGYLCEGGGGWSWVRV